MLAKYDGSVVSVGRKESKFGTFDHQGLQSDVLCGGYVVRGLVLFNVVIQEDGSSLVNGSGVLLQSGWGYFIVWGKGKTSIQG